MAVLDYTTYPDIRAALGVSDDEIGDTTLELDLYALGLETELQDIATALPADFATVEAIEQEDRSVAEQAFYAAVKLFAPYAVGVQLASGLPMFAPKAITDGKAGITRDSNSPYKDAIAACRIAYERARARLVARYATYTGGAIEATFRPLFVISSPTIDPVTGA